MSYMQHTSWHPTYRGVWSSLRFCLYFRPYSVDGSSMTGKLIETDWERRGWDAIEARSADVEELGKATQNLRDDSSFADIDSNRTPPEYKSRALRIYTRHRYTSYLILQPD